VGDNKIHGGLCCLDVFGAGYALFTSIIPLLSAETPIYPLTNGGQQRNAYLKADPENGGWDIISMTYMGDRGSWPVIGASGTIYIALLSRIDVIEPNETVL